MTMSFVIERSDCQMSSGVITTNVSYAKESCQTGSRKLSSHSSFKYNVRSTCEKVNPIYTRQQAIVTSLSKLGYLQIGFYGLKINLYLIHDFTDYKFSIQFNPQISKTESKFNPYIYGFDIDLTQSISDPPFYRLICEFKIFNFAQSTK